MHKKYPNESKSFMGIKDVSIFKYRSKKKTCIWYGSSPLDKIFDAIRISSNLVLFFSSFFSFLPILKWECSIDERKIIVLNGLTYYDVFLPFDKQNCPCWIRKKKFFHGANQTS